MLQALVEILYHLFVAWVVVAMVRNLVQAKSWEREVLYVVVLLPFVLRLLRLK